MITAKSIILDFTRAYTEPINLVQYEVDSRDLNFTLVSSGLPIDLTTASVTFYAIKPDDTILYNSCSVVSAADGTITYTVTEQTCTVAGDLECWIEIIDGSEALRSIKFIVTVHESEDESGAIESTSEFTALETALSTVSGLDARVTQNESDISGLLDFFYPIGTIYETVSSNLNTPEKMAAHFGGTWVAWGTGRVPVGVDSGDGSFDTVEETGGAKTINIRHGHGGVTGTMNIPFLAGVAKQGGSELINHAHTISNDLSATQSVLQPYITRYAWKRTA